MRCDNVRPQASAFVDGALDRSTLHAVSTHLRHCSACAAWVADLRAAGSAVASLGREAVPAGLSERLVAGLAASSERPAPSAAMRLWHRLDRRTMPLRAVAATVLLVAVLSGLGTWSVLESGDARHRLEQDLVSAHLRALMQDRPFQVASSDRHTVKPWFAGKVDFAPDVAELSADGFTLLGGRLDVVAGRRVGALVYGRRQHLIDVFAWPAGADAEAQPVLSRVQGFQILRWTRHGISYAAVSDVDAAELRRLADPQ